MADQSKSQYSFGASTNSGASGTLFGQQNSTGQPQGGVSGSNKPTSTSGPSLFGTNTSAGANSLFGGGTATTGQPQTIFGAGGERGGADKPTPSFSFSHNPAGGSGGGGSSLFGQAPSSAGQQPGTPTLFSGFATPNKPASSANAGPSQSSNIFRGASNPFQTTRSSAPGTAATPTSKPALSFPPVGSTTPADPPPSNQTGGSNAFNLNLNNQQPEKNSLFPATGGNTSSNQAPPQLSSAPSQNATGSGSGLFGNFGKPQKSSSTQPPASTGGSSMFATSGNQTSAAPSGSQEGATSLFAKPGQSSAAEAQRPTFSFPPASSQAPGHNVQKTQSSTPSLFNLGPSTKPPAATASVLSTNPFGNLGKSNDTPASTAPQASGAARSIFANTGNTQEAPSSSAGAATANTQAPVPAKPSTSNLFGKSGQAATSATSFQSNPAAATNTAEAKGNTNAAAGGTLGQSTSGPAPSAQSRLKNKSMDEIITRWASDLAKYQKEFQKQAEKVATWDHMLVENSEKIQKLYGSTLEAERATAEVERQITAVENDQDELESWLSKYEEKIDQMTSNSGDSYHRPDQERQRTYELAEKLSTRLDEMWKDLGSMIDEINDASSALNKNTKPDDPLSQVVRVLNSHLTQLQQIDQGAAALQLKVATAQKASQTLSPANGLNGPSSDAADSFYRSFMGRR
ncbi:MAG: hypothetical protein LQ343_002747 [Gyalolechia ehrenbergii]|nr:MAG: hypothetical protein LQ343_002747 [Gyalolechia ehrenbergii]